MRRIILTLLVLLNIITISAQDNDAEYTKVLTQRSEKIVKELNLQDQPTHHRVVEALVDQYKNVGQINDNAEAAKKSLKAESVSDKLKQERLIQIENERNAKLYQQSCIFMGQLAQDLDCAQIIQIKDGLTYGVVKVTYDSYLDMIPSLSDIEKKQIYGWLVEAREQAINASSSKEKHGMFGKYKGRINNYLSGRGYNISNERKNWEERLKAQGKTL